LLAVRLDSPGKLPMHKIGTAIVASTILIAPAFAHDDDHGRWDDNDRGHHVHGAPGPIAGAGLTSTIFAPRVSGPSVPNI
jgi:hypothetical protein